MQTEIEATTVRQRVEAGQTWKVESGYVYIVELGQRLIHYRLLRHPQQKAAITRIIAFEALLNYLAINDGVLVH